jgi:hypothetical protein
MMNLPTERFKKTIEREVTRRHATRWTRGAQMKRWIKWSKVAIGFMYDGTRNDHKVIHEGQLGRFSNCDPQSHDNAGL